jgi:hypothetical protein
MTIFGFLQSSGKGRLSSRDQARAWVVDPVFPKNLGSPKITVIDDESQLETVKTSFAFLWRVNVCRAESGFVFLKDPTLKCGMK